MASSSQIVDEIRTTSPEERKMLLEQAGIKPEVPFGLGLAMKSQLSIPWNKVSHLRWSVMIRCVHNTVYSKLFTYK